MISIRSKMTVDKTALKKMIDSAKKNDLMVVMATSLDKNSQRKVRSELERFMRKSGEYIIFVVSR
jgi:NAD-dependent SIR2 family protein deacetylase